MITRHPASPLHRQVTRSHPTVNEVDFFITNQQSRNQSLFEKMDPQNMSQATLLGPAPSAPPMVYNPAKGTPVSKLMKVPQSPSAGPFSNTCVHDSSTVKKQAVFNSPNYKPNQNQKNELETSLAAIQNQISMLRSLNANNSVYGNQDTPQNSLVATAVAIAHEIDSVVAFFTRSPRDPLKNTVELSHEATPEFWRMRAKLFESKTLAHLAAGAAGIRRIVLAENSSCSTASTESLNNSALTAAAAVAAAESCGSSVDCDINSPSSSKGNEMLAFVQGVRRVGTVLGGAIMSVRSTRRRRQEVSNVVQAAEKSAAAAKRKSGPSSSTSATATAAVGEERSALTALQRRLDRLLASSDSLQASEILAAQRLEALEQTVQELARKVSFQNKHHHFN